MFERETGKKRRALAAALAALAAIAVRLPAAAEGPRAAAQDRAQRHAQAPSRLQAVGLEAVGVDARSALRSDLDVRDAFNRPVSRRVVERQLAAAAAAADKSGEASRLPIAREVWRALDRALTGTGLSGRPPAPGAPAAHRWPWLPKPPAPSLAPAPAACLAASSLLAAPALPAPAAALRSPQVLRC